MSILEKYVKGGVFGLAVGDALGVPVEFCSREERDKDTVREMREYGTHNQPVGTWSDDTSMVLATMAGMSCGGLSLGAIMDQFVEWLTKAKYTATGVVFDVGGTSSRAITGYMMGEDLSLCGERDEYSNGNGSLMRMLPMVYYTYLTHGVGITSLSIDNIYKLSSLTHAHIISKVCCVYYVYIGIYLMVFGYQIGIEKAVKEAIEEVEKYYYVECEEIPCTIEITGMDSLSDCIGLDRDEISSTGYVIDSLEASIWCLCNSNSYREAVEMAVNLGGDTDTIGAITGSLAGIYYGVKGIPKEWVEELKNKEEIIGICDRFYDQYK